MQDNDFDDLVTIAWVFMPLSMVAIGGGGAVLAPMAHQAVDVHGWFDKRQFIDYFAISRAAPGPGAMIVTLIGWHVAMWTGALVASLAMFVPSSVLCFGVAKVWNRYRGTEFHKALEDGLVPIGIGFMGAGAVAILRASDTGPFGWMLAAISTALLMWRSFHPLLVLAIGGAMFALARTGLGV